MTTSQAVELEAIRALVRKWRDNANEFPLDQWTAKDFADDLEAALGSGPDGKMGEAGASGPTETVAVEAAEPYGYVWEWKEGGCSQLWDWPPNDKQANARNARFGHKLVPLYTHPQIAKPSTQREEDHSIPPYPTTGQGVPADGGEWFLMPPKLTDMMHDAADCTDEAISELAINLHAIYAAFVEARPSCGVETVGTTNSSAIDSSLVVDVLKMLALAEHFTDMAAHAQDKQVPVYEYCAREVTRLADELRRLKASTPALPTKAMAVTDEMVEAALDTWYGKGEAGSRNRECMSGMRAALEAALSTTGQNMGEGK